MTLYHATLERMARLGLRGMAEAFEEQAVLPGARELGFEDRLAMLLQREVDFQDTRSYQARLRRAQLRVRADLADVSCRAGRGISRTELTHLGAGEWICKAINLIVCGATGAGKTWIACALANQACRQHHSVLYRRMPELVEEFAAIRGTGAHARLMRRLKRVDLLVLDDWGLQPFAPESRRDIFEIVEFRERRASLLVAGQVPPEHWHGVIGEGAIADAMLDRMVHYAYRIDLAGESMRRMAEPPDLARDASA